MPIYEFVCEACGRIVERLQKVSDPPPAECPECGGEKMAKIMSRNSFQLKGGGWYRDLYSSGKGATNTADKGSETSATKKSDAPAKKGEAPAKKSDAPAKKSDAPAAPAEPKKTPT